MAGPLVLRTDVTDTKYLFIPQPCHNHFEFMKRVWAQWMDQHLLSVAQKLTVTCMEGLLVQLLKVLIVTSSFTIHI